jgi:histidinol-phosphate/aromatic aminotransferase/cobyric acid decarboxylase-like protein
MTLDLLHVCFEVIFDDKIAAIKLEAALTRRDLLLRRMRTGSGKRKKCVTVTWAVPEEEMEHLESDLAEADSADDRPEKHPMMH